MDRLAFETSGGSVDLAVPGAELRPATNFTPSVATPRRVSIADARDGLTGVWLNDPDELPGDYGLLLASRGGSISVGTPLDVQFFGENGSDWIPLVGPLPALNDSLAELRYDPGPGGGTLLIIVTDYGHGDLRRALAGTAEIEVSG